MTNDTDTPIPLTPNALTILKKRYLRPGETTEARFRTVAEHVAEGERAFGGTDARVRFWADRFYARMAALEFLPNSPTLVNPESATESRGCLSACFVVPIEDSQDGMLEAHRQAAKVVKAGGGVGFSFGRIRPKGSPIKTTHNASCGPVAVIKMMNAMSDTFTQGGAFREGAMMAMLPIGHPDIHAFIHAKDADPQALRHFNISVVVDDAFMAALRSASPYVDLCPQCSPDGTTNLPACAACVKWDKHTDAEPGAEYFCYPLQFGGRVHEWVDARDLWREIAESAHATGDPGIFFVDTANDDNPVPHLYTIESTNPCGEVALGPYEPCNLGSIAVNRFLLPFRLGSFVESPSADQAFDLDRLRECVYDAVRFLDNVVEVNRYPTPEIDEAARRTRKIGLGVMGVADALAALRIPYGSGTAVSLMTELMAVISAAADSQSMMLADERGVYPGWAGSEHEKAGVPYRNATRTCIAPTGTIAEIAGVNQGCEPFFGLEFDRRMEDGTVLNSRVPAYEAWRQSQGFVLPDIVPVTPPGYLQTAMEIRYEYHIKMQAAFQKYTDLAVSKTINLPEHATVEDVADAYKLAHELGCKGITVWRHNCRKGVLSIPSEEQNDGAIRIDSGAGDERAAGARLVVPDAGDSDSGRPRELPADLVARRHKVTIDGTTIYIHVGLDEDGQIAEVFLTGSKAGSERAGMLNALSRLFSTALQAGAPLETLTRSLRSLQFSPAGFTSNPDIRTATSIVDYVARYLDALEAQQIAREYIEFPSLTTFWGTSVLDTAAALDELRTPTMSAREAMLAVGIEDELVADGNGCPECGSALIRAEGCLSCRACGFYRCG